MDKDAVIDSLQKTIEHQSKMIEKLSGQLEQLLRKLYGKKSEKSTPASADSNGQIVPTIAVAKSAVSNKPGNKPKRSRLPDYLERINVVHDIAEEKKSCSHCHQKLHRMGERVSEQVDYIPAKMLVKRHLCYKYACRCGNGGVVTATMPNQPIEKGLPGPGLLAEVLVSKYQDAMPLYRQMLRFKRYGYECSDSTMGDWVRECAFLLEPIVNVLRDDLLLARKLHTDDTPVPVLAKGKTKQGRLWVYLADSSAPHSICIYDYTPTRSKSGPCNFLNDYRGYLQADAYSGYDALYKEKDIIEVGCMAHARRKFFDVASAAKGDSYAADIVNDIAKLYAIETTVKTLSEYERYYYRKKYAKPELHKFRRKITRLMDRAIPGTPFYKALQYADNHWIALMRYLADGALDIDNNKAERAIKPLVIGRKNWMFAGSHNGGKRAAIVYSIIETCKMNNVNSFEYLRDVLARIPNTKQSQIRSLLPYHWKPDLNP